MGIVTVLWSLVAGVSIALAIVGGCVWMVERRDPVSLTLFLLGLAVAASAYLELCMMHSVTPVEYGEWLRWYHIPMFFAFLGQILFVRYYLGASSLWLLCAVVTARFVVLIVNFAVHPNFKQISLLSKTVQSFVSHCSEPRFPLERRSAI